MLVVCQIQAYSLVFDPEEVFARLHGNLLFCVAHSRWCELEHAHGLRKRLVSDAVQCFAVCEGGGMLNSS